MMSGNTMQYTGVESNIIIINCCILFISCLKPFIVYFKHSFLLV